MHLTLVAGGVLHPPVPVVVGVRRESSIRIIPGSDPCRLVGAELVGAVDDLIAVHISAESIVHRVLPDRHWYFSIELVVVLVVIGESAVDGATQYDSAVEITLFINSTVSSARGPVERLGNRLQTGQCHVDIVFLHQKSDGVPDLHPTLGVGRLA